MPGASHSLAPDILILGQITVDDTVPATPGPWQRRLGGNALYATAGARLWAAGERIGMVARVPADLPFDLPAILARAGLRTEGLIDVEIEPLVEWIVYEEDGQRQSFPRNPYLRDPAATMEELFQRYLAHLESLSASREDIPASWLPARAIHLSPQVMSRHSTAAQTLADKTEFLSIDPSPHYSRSRQASELVAMLPGVTAFLPSQAEVQHFTQIYPDWLTSVAALRAAGFREVLLKRGSDGALLAYNEKIVTVPAAKAKPTDLTGAGDAFSGAYAASRAVGHPPIEAAARATVAAAMIVECSGTHEAFALRPEDAECRLELYLSSPKAV